MRNRLKPFYLSYLSSPASDRLIYRTIRRHRVCKILECGIGIGSRALRMIEAAGFHASPNEIRYAGIDLFEDRTAADGPGVTLKMAHRLLKTTQARIQLIPGDLLSALARTANSLTGTGLVIISARQDRRSLAAAWFYFPRLLHAESQVLLEEALPGGRMRLRSVGPAEIRDLSEAAKRHRAA